MSGWVPLFIALHIATAIAVFVALQDFNFVDQSLYLDVVATGSKDALNVANQIGRLDALTLVLSVIGLIATISAVLGFWFYRGVVDHRAKTEVKELLPRLLDDYIRKNPSVVAEALRANAELARAGLLDEEEHSDFSEEIASTMDGGKEP